MPSWPNRAFHQRRESDKKGGAEVAATPHDTAAESSPAKSDEAVVEVATCLDSSPPACGNSSLSADTGSFCSAPSCESVSRYRHCRAEDNRRAREADGRRRFEILESVDESLTLGLSRPAAWDCAGISSGTWRHWQDWRQAGRPRLPARGHPPRCASPSERKAAIDFLKEHGDQVPLQALCEHVPAVPHAEFIAEATLDLLREWRVEPLFNPPRRPAYNGGLGRTHPILKSYTLAAAAAQGRPAGILLTEEQRDAFRRSVQDGRPAARASRGLAEEAELNHHQRAAVDREAIRDALLAHDLLEILPYGKRGKPTNAACSAASSLPAPQSPASPSTEPPSNEPPSTEPPVAETVSEPVLAVPVLPEPECCQSQ